MEQREQTEMQTDTQSAAASKKPPVSRKKRWICRIFALFLLLIVAFLAFIATGKGQRTLLSQLDNGLEPLTLGKVEGSLQDGLVLSDARFVAEGVEVALGEAKLHLDFGCLLQGKACVEQVALSNAQVVVDTTKLPPSEAKPETTSTEFNLPLGVELRNLSVDNFRLQVDQMDLTLNHFHSGIRGKEKDLELEATELNGLRLSLAPSQMPSNETEKREQREKSEPIDWKALETQLSQPLLTKLDPIKLPLNLAIPSFNASDIQIVQKQTEGEPTSIVRVSHIGLEAKSDANSVALKQLKIDSDKGNVHGNGLLTLADNYPLNWQLHADVPNLSAQGIPASQADMTLSGELFGTTALNLKTQGAVAAEMAGSVQLAEAKTPFTLSLKSPQVQYPFVAEKGVEPLQLKNIALDLSGDLLNYQLNTRLAASGMHLPSSELNLSGKGGLTHFEVGELLLKALQGSAKLNGKVQWQNGVAWQSALNLDNIHTQSLTPEWAAVLSGGLQSEGYAARGDNQWAVQLSHIDLHGNVLQKALQLKGELKADAAQLLNVSKLNLIYGENNIALNGVLGKQSDFHADIQAPNLRGLVPNLSAALNGKIQLSGDISQPNLDLDLTASNVAYQQLKLQHLTAKGKITTDKQIQGNLELALQQFSQGDLNIQTATLQAAGSEANHQLKLSANGQPAGVNLQLFGKFDRNQQSWQGELANVVLQSPVGEWKNNQNVRVHYQQKVQSAEISAHCWQNAKLNLCFPQTFKAGAEGNVPFEIKAFDLAMVQPYLDKNSQINGEISAKGQAAWFSNKAPEVSVELNSNRVQFKQLMDYKAFPITVAPLKLNAELANNNLQLKTDIQLENNGRLNSDLTVKDVAGARGLSGSLRIERLTLALLAPLLNSGEKVAGDINANLTLGGSALSPLLHGKLDLTNLKASATTMPFDVTGGHLALNFNGASSTLKGNVQTKESDLLLEGEANWQRLDAWFSRIKAKANRFRVNVPNMAKVDVSPDIEVKVTPKELLLGGKIDIPWARIAVEELPDSAVSVSSDEVIMDGSVKNKKAALPQTLPQQSGAMAIKADIAINVGNDVKLDAYGLKTDLGGTIKVRQGSKGLGLYGQINLKNGTFASFGQDLIIRRGLISFTGLPSQPTLDIEAIRNPEAMEDSSITAGVKVSGMADTPEVKIFSNPSMPQDEALSYILTGRGLENSGDAGSSNSIAAALIGMSLSKSSKLVGGVGSAFGINDLNVTTAGIGDNTKVVVSGSLTPKFKVKYGVGIFAPLTELTLRYRLAPSLYLQWVSSINQAIDLMYRFEFD